MKYISFWLLALLPLPLAAPTKSKEPVVKVSVVTELTKAVFNVTVDTRASGVLQYNTADATAVAGMEYVPVSGSIAYPSGRSKHQVEVPLYRNNSSDAAKMFRMQIQDRNVASAAIGAVPFQVIATGDIACRANLSRVVKPDACQHEKVAALARSRNFDAFFALGDIQYPSGSLADFQSSFDVSFGFAKDRVKPAVGNHEWETPNAQGYRDYFGERFQTNGDLWYSFDVGSWHVVSLDSSCAKANCRREAAWLARDIANSRTRCTAVVMHHPPAGSGSFSANSNVMTLWRQVVQSGVTVALAGHEHSYERLSAVSETGRKPRRGERGVPLFIVGSGGVGFHSAGKKSSLQQYRATNVFGVLGLSLEAGSYTYEYQTTEGKILDAGRASC
jgi:hypothetical protein